MTDVGTPPIETPPLTLEIDGDRLRMDTPDAFELWLSARREVRTLKHARLRALGDDALAAERDGIGKLRDIFEDIVARTVDDPRAVGRFLRRMAINLISQDNAWRSIFAALAAEEPAFDPYKRLAVVVYLEYLDHRAELAGAIARLRERHRDGAHLEGARDAEVRPPGAPGRPSAQSPEGLVRRQRLVFDLADLCLPYERGPALVRMPKGRAVTMSLDPCQSLGMVLGTHRFALVAGDPWRLVDPDGHDLWVPAGRSVVGRGGRSSIVVDPGFDVVSRQHLVVDIGTNGILRLTDISTYGTYVAGDRPG